MAPLRYTAKFDPFLSLDCAPALHPGTIQGKEGKGSNFAIWQHYRKVRRVRGCRLRQLPDRLPGLHRGQGLRELLDRRRVPQLQLDAVKN